MMKIKEAWWQCDLNFPGLPRRISEVSLYTDNKHIYFVKEMAVLVDIVHYDDVRSFNAIHIWSDNKFSQRTAVQDINNSPIQVQQ